MCHLRGVCQRNGRCGTCYRATAKPNRLTSDRTLTTTTATSRPCGRASAHGRTTPEFPGPRLNASVNQLKLEPATADPLGATVIEPDPVSCSRATLVVSGTEDKYSRDTGQLVAKVARDFITELRVERGHALENDRFDAIAEWIVGRVAADHVT